MSFKLRILSVIACLSIVTPSSFVFASEPSYSEAAKQLQQRLGKVLMSTIQSEGHIAAIAVCNEQAPAIAQAVSDDLNVQVGRTALKVRNPGNTASEAQQDVLRAFQQQWQKSKDKVPSQTYTDDSGKTVWMKAIVMQPQCAACHGSNVKPELKQAINARYPDDQATGFEVGDIRGAFVVREN
ncbi:MAG: hypothetical protein CMF12_13280 [Idiomarina sp.]|uniref:Tll0287-like domain-containing protein n=1 Tax=Idiomarina sp. TaxID=1874361 RepID=UPI000C10E783|nr:DUF3365 domain-containing protein [Idiomarina sp.]MAK71695.1 hypothetical protein [Idiomarinaceae bacterium]MBL4741837.1 DUF3365 domain-containing protein [Idiomarina sp.]MBT43480.1 hypothetical protein [Idiomarina sp.]PHQ77526.1 MAG: hypothetical protein COB75_02800 [Idiomarina sp.]HAD47848.1 hypothetical protein [Idiomarina sp.]|tara:strand:+ start:124 stop:672 length:549 start_codon:yes stop_codon:yes gene_type:complete